MRERLEQVVAELKRRKGRGETHVAVDALTLEALRARVKTLARPDAPVAMPAAKAPSPTGEAAAKISSAQASAAGPRFSKPIAHRAAAGLSAEDETIPADAPVVELPEGDKTAQWAWLKARVLNCPVCKAHVHPGRQVVFGVGNVDADIFFCGEAPGMEESVQGEPFVGPAGQLLTKMIGAMGLSRAQVYIGNIMNWRPRQPTEVGNREPSPREMNFCLPYLKAQVGVVKPKVIVALGRTAVNALLAPESPLSIGKVRGQWFDFKGIPLIPTYHPSYLLRDQTVGARRQVWEDLMRVMERVGLDISEKQRGYFLKK